ncbi:hypothetical protein J8I87_11725 [Paraburkholderia sp. LEh10]|uniref:hypothetical protein n=1 Tax=Paraburkholderia sp. LEh10 TaxID=2821353 RepID=UPI001AE6D8D2|nr:hypothetical protein [Paraburkholderia sp. LEh10]MBP0590369.1 hypothetical protein [Paraburkholderia sp. LEh10]
MPLHNRVAPGFRNDGSGAFDGNALSCLLKAARDVERLFAAALAIRSRELELRRQSVSRKLGGNPSECCGRVSRSLSHGQSQQHFRVRFVERVDAENSLELAQ